MILKKLSERVPPTGGLHADGFANILGRPALDPLTLVLREAGQNIWDARLRAPGSSPPRMLVRVRTLTEQQSGSFKRAFSCEDTRSAEPLAGDDLSHHLALVAPIRVLEICDFGTVGLSGGVDPTSEQGNFVRFFFDVGTPHAGGSDGGTYGYGRSSLYLAGRAKTILVDTQVHGAEGAPRRLMACRLGPGYVKQRLGGAQHRFTGRHFWGGRVEGEAIFPLENEEAKSLADSLGMPRRDTSSAGTSILIPWPQVPETELGRNLVSALLHNLWPKLVEISGRRPMEIAVEVDGMPIPLPDPRRHPHYAPFASALRLVRNPSPETGVVAISVGRTPLTTGHLAIEVTHAAPIPAPAQSEDGAPDHEFARGVNHVALMRPSELVVRYLPFPGVAADTQWGGVFMCSEEPAVRDAFAASEPPAHDDWVPDRLPDSERTIVRVSLKRIREQVLRRFAASDTMSRLGGSGMGVSLAAAADRFARQFLAGGGTGGDLVRGGGTTVGGSRSVLGSFRFDSIRLEGGNPIARFEVDCSEATGKSVRAVAKVITGGRSSEAIPSDIAQPRVLGWTLPDGQTSPGDRCALIQLGRYGVEVKFEGRYAIDVRHETVD